MTAEQLSERLRALIMAGPPLRQIVSMLREYRREGITRTEVQRALDALRDEAEDEVTEDRILEVMDVVSGFCARENTVWDE
jgi:hypothetical protein